MKVEIKGMGRGWYWKVGNVAGPFYSRRRDAVRGFERFCAAIRGMK